MRRLPFAKTCEELVHYPILQGERIRTDVKCAGKDGVLCDQMMLVVRGPYGVYLKCSNPSCNGTRNIR